MRELLVALFLSTLEWLERRAGVAVDADPDRGRLRRAGDRLREWLRANRSGGGE